MINLKESKSNFIMLVVFIAIAYLFALSMRYFWVAEFRPMEQMKWNNELMINTNDGYWFAEGARDIIQGYHQENDMSGIDTPLAQLTANISKIVPVSFETLILYLPAFLGSLVVVPIILIGRILNQTSMGFMAALLASIAHSYYNRTMTGYYDTDMLNIVLPAITLFLLILVVQFERIYILGLITLSVALSQWWYPQAYALNTAFFVMMFSYTVIFDRKNLFLYCAALFILIGVIDIPIWIKLLLAFVLNSILHFFRFTNTKEIIGLFVIFFGVFLYFGGLDPIWFFLKGYLFPELKKGNNGLHFYDVMSTVREAGHIDFTLFAERISGNVITFLISAVGYTLAVFAYRPLLLALPFVGLGFLAMSAGLRFTIYAVVPMAIGFGFIVMLSTQMIKNFGIRSLILVGAMSAALYPNYTHIKEYMTPTVFTAKEVAVMDQLRSIATPEDYVVAWWDYGYPLRYYSDIKTWIDGGQHSGYDNYPASLVLTTSDPTTAAHMMRLFTEYSNISYQDTNNSMTKFEYMLDKEKILDPDEFLTAISFSEYKTPSKTSDIYLYLPLRMMDIFPTVALFSNIDLKNPENKLPQPFFYMTQQFQDTGKLIELGNGLSIDKEKSMLKVGMNEMPIKSFYQVGYDNQQKIQINEQHFASDGMNIIFMASYGRFLVVDDFYLNSTYFQMFIFERYDKKLFEPVILDPLSKVYKLKI